MPFPAFDAHRPTLRRWAAGGLAALLSCLLNTAQAAPPDSADAMTWARAAVALRTSLAEARARPSAAEPARAAFLASRTVARGHVTGETRALVLEAQTRYEALLGGAALSVALGRGELAALRGALLDEALAHAGAPLERGDAVGEALARRAAEAEAAALEAARAAEAALTVRANAPHFEYPAAAQAVMDRQTSVARRRFGGLSRRARRVFPGIERALRRRGVPAEMKFVAVIESALNAGAESSAGAAGMWQFMPATAQEFGLDSLTVHDVGASTDAAARYLRQLGRMFNGDWQLALAAYNCGPGRVRTLVRAHRAQHGGSPGFWDIYDALPRETQAYVPRFIAVAEMYGAVRR